MVITNRGLLIKNQVQMLIGSKKKAKTNGRTNHTDCINYPADAVSNKLTSI